MPGFKIAESQDRRQKPIPDNVVYTYTWIVPHLVGVGIARAATAVYLKDVTLPSYSLSVESIKTGHTTYPVAKGIVWKDIKLSFYDTHKIGKWLWSISQRAWSPQKGLRAPGEYMADSKIEVHYADDTIAYTWTMKNSWIKSIAFSKLTYETSGINNVNVTLAYSWAEQS